MKLHTRLTALLLALLTATSLIACAADNGNSQETAAGQANTPTVTTPAETEDPNARASAKDSLPDGLKFEGEEIRILYRAIDQIRDYDLVGADNTGDVVLDAVWLRNRSVEERLGITFNMIPSDGSSIADVKNQIVKTVSAASDDYEVIVGTGNTLPQGGVSQYLLSLNDAKYLDFSQPWWANDAMDELCFDLNQRKFLIGDFLNYNLLSTGAVYFNRDMYTNLYGNPTDLYQQILDGKWTLDDFSKLVEGAYIDANGNTQADAEDTFGMIAYTGSGSYHFQYATDIPSYTRDENGLPVFSNYDDRTINFVDKMIALYAMNATTRASESDMLVLFAENKSLFMPFRLQASFNGVLRDMNSDFGVIPYPKLDEAQADYMTMIHDCSSCAALPKTNSKVEATTAALEALNAESYRSVTEKVYEVALKAKYVRDDVSSQMIDIIHESATKNFMAEYASLLGGIGHYVFNCVENGNNTVASSYATTIKSATKQLERQLEKLQEE